MHRYKRLLVGVSLGKQDGASIRYAGMISRLAKSEKIIFFHVTSAKDLPDDLRNEFPDLAEPADKSVKEGLEALVEKHFDGYSKTKLECEVAEGSPLVEFLRRAKEYDIDLIVMRKARGPAVSGTLFEKIARKAPCSVMFVPEGTKTWFNDIVVPVDFSENSADALEVSVAFALASSVSQIHCLHVYDVPIGYYKTGKSYEQFAEIMKGHAEKNYREFIAGIDLRGVSVVPVFKLAKKASVGIEETINTYDRFLVVIGARGRRAAAAVLLGSVAEHLIKTSDLPILAVKKKGTGMSLLDALLKL